MNLVLTVTKINGKTTMIDLCVVHHNTTSMIQRMLDELHLGLNEQEKQWKLYITDNDSSDNFIEFIRNCGHNYNIQNLFLRKNIGYSTACNYMASKTDSEIIGLLNGDVWMSNSDVNKIQKIFDENPEIHILGPKQRDEYGRITHAGITGTNSAPVMRGWMVLDRDDLLFKDRVSCVTISGSAYFIRREVWNVLASNPDYKKIHPNSQGAFLPTPHYYEETWCSYFARHLGYGVFYDGSVSIGHSWHASSAKPGEGVSHVDHFFPISREIFRKSCDYFNIERD